MSDDMNQELDKHVIVVLGMHRSGTSAITRGLSALGVELGENLIPAVPGNNDKGFWEDLDLNTFDNDLLRALGHDWHTLTPITHSELAGDKIAEFKMRAVTLLRDKLSGNRIFGMKDPRVARLLPFWKGIFQHLRVQVSYVIACRNPLSVADSLKKRDAISIEKSCYLWLQHTVPCFTETEGAARVVVDYDLLMDQPEVQLERVARVLGLAFDPKGSALAEYRQEFLDVNLRHTQYEAPDLRLTLGVPDEVIDAYLLLRRLAGDDIPIESEQVRAAFSIWSKSIDGLRPALTYMTGIENALYATHCALSERAARITDLERILSEQIQNITNLNQAAAEREARITAIDRALSERDIQIASLNQVAAEREARITAICHALSERDEQIASLNQAAAEREARITAIYHTLSERDEQIASLDQVVAEREARITAIDRTLSERDEQIASLDQVVAEREARITASDRTLSERDVQIASLNQTAAERDMRISSLDQALSECEDRILNSGNTVTQMSVNLASLQAERTELLSSFSWRITKPLRAILENRFIAFFLK